MISDKEVLKEAGLAGVDAQVIERDYVLSWMLIAIAESELAPRMAFKGGTALKRVYLPDYRFSEDLDFTLLDDLSHDDLVQAFVSLFPSLKKDVNLALSLRTAEQSAFRSTSSEVYYAGPLQAGIGSRFLKLDFTRGELLLERPVEGVLRAGFTDYPEGVAVPTYTLREILAEKLCALIGRTEPRDLYDVYELFESGDVDQAFLWNDFAAKCEHKERDPTLLQQALDDKAARLEKQWQMRLAQQVTDLPHFNEVMRTVQRHVRRLATS
jgi:predicted nucleotidyltransferase component of viral defense system